MDYLGAKSWTCLSCELRKSPYIFQYYTKEVENQWGHWRKIFPKSASFYLGHCCACVLSITIGRGMKQGKAEVMTEVVNSPQNSATPLSLDLPQCPAKNLLIWRSDSSNHLPLCLSLFTLLSGRTWRRQWHPTPVLLPGKSHGWRSLVGCSPWGHCESDSTSLSLFIFMHWRRKWQPTPVFLPGESQGWGSLVGCRLWGRTELDMTEAT